MSDRKLKKLAYEALALARVRDFLIEAGINKKTLSVAVLRSVLESVKTRKK